MFSPCVCVIMLKWGPRETYYSRNYHRKGFDRLFSGVLTSLGALYFAQVEEGREVGDPQSIYCLTTPQMKRIS